MEAVSSWPQSSPLVSRLAKKGFGSPDGMSPMVRLPGKLTKRLGIDLSFNGLDILTTDRISLWQGPECAYDTAPRVGIGYASEEDQARLWRFIRKGN